MADSFAFDFSIENDGAVDERSGTLPRKRLDEYAEYYSNAKNITTKTTENTRKNEGQEISLNFIPVQLDQSLDDLVFDTLSISNNKILCNRDNNGPPTSLRRVRSVNRHCHLDDHDLIPGVYEGGLKTWECSIDLCRYLYELYTIESGEGDLAIAVSSNGTTLELGCGHGLPGIFVSILGAANGSKVLFSDYNDYVLQYVTLKNLFLNTPLDCQSSLHTRTFLVSGDWMDLSDLMTRGDNNFSPFHPRFDLILAAETTYTESSARDTAILISRHLKYESGVAFVATKRYYFGVRGGTECFQTNASAIHVERTSEGHSTKIYSLNLTTVKVYDDGVGNIREILRVQLLETSDAG